MKKSKISKTQTFHHESNLKLVESLDKIIFGLTEDNTNNSVKVTMKLIDKGFFNYFNLIISRLIYSSFFSQKKDFNVFPFYEYFKEYYKELSQNDWELHKKYVKEGHNPSEIAKIIRNDEIEKLQEISSQTNFNIDQTIKPSLYERCSFINEETVTLIDYAAFFSSVQCFKYLLMNGANVENTGKYAVVGGNEEIIHLCEQNHSSFEGAYESAIMFHRNDIFHYLYQNKDKKYSFKKIMIVFSTNHLTNIKIYNFLFEQKEISVNAKIFICFVSNLFLLFYISKSCLEII